MSEDIHTLDIDYQSTLETAARGMIRFKTPQRLIKLISRFIVREVKVEHAGILLYDKKEDNYVLLDSKGEAKRDPAVSYIKYLKQKPFIQFFARNKNYLLNPKGALVYTEVVDYLNNYERLHPKGTLVYRDILNYLHSQKLSREKSIDPAELIYIKRQMETLKAEIIIPSYFKSEFMGSLILGHKISGAGFSDKEISLFVTLASDVTMVIKNAEYIDQLKERYNESESQRIRVQKLYRKIKQDYLNIEKVIGRVVDARDKYTLMHSLALSQLVKNLITILRRYFGVKFSLREEKLIHTALIAHDLGKIGVLDRILWKKSGLTAKEWELMKRHPAIGAQILNLPGDLRTISKIVLHHQERFDGKGYPRGLKGNQIPLGSKIIAVVDAYHAMTSDRPYRKKMAIKEALEELIKNSGKQFDPIIIDAFLMFLTRERMIPKGMIGQIKNRLGKQVIAV